MFDVKQLFFLNCLFTMAFQCEVEAMEFEYIVEPEQIIQGYKFKERISIIAAGEIKEGDSKKFETALRKAGRDPYGNITIYLQSEGGSVKEALKMARLMEYYEVSAIVPRASVCVSACAAIVYLSTRLRTVEDGGFLVFHSCKSPDGLDLELCNEIVANNALMHGTPWGSVKSVMDVKIHSELIKKDPKASEFYGFDRTLAMMVGLSGPPVGDLTLAIPSFDCNRAIMRFEKRICANLQLARYDASSHRIYTEIFKHSEIASKLNSDDVMRRAFNDEKLVFIENREKCVNDDCLLKVYSGWRGFLFEQYAGGVVFFLVKKISDEFVLSEEDKSLFAHLMAQWAYLDCPEGENGCNRHSFLDNTHAFFIYNLVIEGLDGIVRKYSNKSPVGHKCWVVVCNEDNISAR